MKRSIKSLLATLVVSLSLAAPVMAGPLEDASAARKRGDYATALKLLRPLAEQGNAAAQNNIGVAYARGKGVPRDYVIAHMWANLAAAQGDKKAEKLRKQLAKLMTPAQIAKAQRLAREWKPKK